MFKDLKLTKVDLIFLLLILITVFYLLFSNIDFVLKYKIYSYKSENNTFKKEHVIETYFDENHPNCYLTEESLSNKEICLNNNGVWLYNSKTCLCRTAQVI